jgi:hypothetical protein
LGKKVMVEEIMGSLFPMKKVVVKGRVQRSWEVPFELRSAID